MISAHHSVLEKNGSALDRCRVTDSSTSSSMRNPVKFENVTIISHHMMYFDRITSTSDNLRLENKKNSIKIEQI